MNCCPMCADVPVLSVRLGTLLRVIGKARRACSSASDPGGDRWGVHGGDRHDSVCATVRITNPTEDVRRGV
jgi:hypothetical protein